MVKIRVAGIEYITFMVYELEVAFVSGIAGC